MCIVVCIHVCRCSPICVSIYLSIYLYTYEYRDMCAQCDLSEVRMMRNVNGFPEYEMRFTRLSQSFRPVCKVKNHPNTVVCKVRRGT